MVAPAAPLRVTVAPLPPLVGVIVPEMLKVAAAAFAVKLTPVTFAVLIVADALVGVNVNPLWLGVMAYVPFASPLKVKAPDAFAVVVWLAAPLRVSVVPDPPVPLTVPVIVNVCGATAVAAKLALVTFAVEIVSASEPGLNVKPVWLGVTV